MKINTNDTNTSMTLSNIMDETVKSFANMSAFSGSGQSPTVMMAAQEGAGVFSNQYIIVKDNLVKKTSKKKDAPQDKSVVLIDGQTSFLARYQAESLNEFDRETFLRHSEISDPFFIRLDFLRDFNNCLKLLSKQDHAEYKEELEKDSTRMLIAKLATRNFHQDNLSLNPKVQKDKMVDLLAEKVTVQTGDIYAELGEGAAPQMQIDRNLEYFAFQVYIEIDVLQNGEILQSKIFTGVKFSYELDEIIQIPLRVCDLAPLSSLAINIYNMDRVEEEPIASTVIDLFDCRQRLRQGTWNCLLHIDKKADLTIHGTTPALTEQPTCIELNRCLRQIQTWRKKEGSKTSWIDRQSFKAMSEKMFELYSNQKEEVAFIEITMPDYGCNVLFSDTHNTPLRHKYNFPQYLVSASANFAALAPGLNNQGKSELAVETMDRNGQMQYYDAAKIQNTGTPLEAYSELYDKVRLANANKLGGKEAQNEVALSIAEQESQASSLKICNFHDPLVMLNSEKFVDRASPISDKFYILTREDNLASAVSLKPDKIALSQIDKLIKDPEYSLLDEESKRLFWRYRYSQSNRKEVLVKFLLSVTWQKASEREAALLLMKQWAEIDIEQALPLLSGFFSCNHTFAHMRVADPLTPEIIAAFKEIRNHAVKCIKTRVPSQTIELVLCQLVQALRYEEFEVTNYKGVQSGLKEFLIESAMRDKTIFNNLYWSFKLESENDSNQEEVQKFFTEALIDLMERGEEESPENANDIKSAVELRSKLLALSNFLKAHPSKVDAKNGVMQAEVQRQDGEHNMMQFEKGMMLPHEPFIKVYGLIPPKCIIFKSAVQPMRLMFNARKFPKDWREGMPLPDMAPYAAVVKNGDDMRQDQLILQMFTLMDSLLKAVNLDFKFTAYRALACSKRDGIMEFVSDSSTVQKVLEDTNRDVSQYLKELSDDPVRQKDILDTYLLSNAGYAVATYLLAIGDRHLENLMLTNNGNMFHLDFGFILGKNPPKKGLWVPPIRINKPMVLGMGGLKSASYEEFKSKTIDAFLFLRNYRKYILHILLIMVDAYIPDLPADDYQRVLSNMNGRFLPDYSNEEARVKFSEIIDESVNASFAEFMEIGHKVSVFMKY